MCIRDRSLSAVLSAHGLVLDKIHRVCCVHSAHIHAAVYQILQRRSEKLEVRIRVKRSSIIKADLAMVENFRTKAVLSKPIAIGCTILEFAKLVMYEFYYDCLLPSFGDRLRLFHRHGQLRLSRRERGLVSELGAIADRWLDTSNFERAHPLYSSTNFRSLGKFISETADVPPTESCSLHSKMYSLSMLTGDLEYRKAKGVPKSYVKKHVTYEQYLHILRRCSAARGRRLLAAAAVGLSLIHISEPTRPY